METKGSTSALLNETYLENTEKITRNCPICRGWFKTTVGGPHICSKTSCQKIRNGYVPKIYPVHLPSNLAGMEEILSNEQTEESVEVEIETIRLLAERSKKC